MVLDNKTARLQIGDQVPITTQTATSTVTANTAIVNSITMQDTGVILSVTPRINESGTRAARDRAGSQRGGEDHNLGHRTRRPSSNAASRQPSSSMMARFWRSAA